MKSKSMNGNIYFDNFVVVKEVETFFAVYQLFSKWEIGYYRKLLTSGKTLDNACKRLNYYRLDMSYVGSL